MGKVYRIGILEPIPAARNAANLNALRKGLRELGYVEGRNLVIEYRSADGRAERFPDLASELVRLKVDLIVTRGTPATIAAKNAKTIPVVMATMGGPGAIVSSFARPGGNITGVITFSTELTAKRIEIIKELVPNLSRVALLHNMSNPAVPPEWEETKTAARSLGLQAELLDVRSQGDLARAFELAVRQHVDALVIGADGLIQTHQQTIVDLAARNRLPAVYPAREFVEAGGLAAYAVNYPDLYFQFARLHRQDLQGREAWRSSCGTADQVRAGHQCEDRQFARPHSAADAARPRRRGDRMRRREFVTLARRRGEPWPLARRSRFREKRGIGVLGVNDPRGVPAPSRRLETGLRQLGYEEGRILRSSIDGPRRAIRPAS